jgi:diamine N-acetyltransferase
MVVSPAGESLARRRNMEDGGLIRIIPLSGIGSIKGLWIKLNDIHAMNSVHFKRHFDSMSFEKRMEKILGMAESDVNIQILAHGDRVTGYCIATKHPDGTGEIDSLYIEEDFRGRQWGETMASRSIAWLEDAGCGKIVAAVACGNERVLPFYMKLGLFPRLMYLEQIREG